MALLTSLDGLWSQFNFKPNDEQREAILHTDGPLYLPAGPGSGKTRVILWRTVNLVACQGRKPEEIFLGTFTEKAAAQLREGIRSLLGAASNHTGQPYDIGRMYVGTIHSLCQRLTTERALLPPGAAKRAPILIDELAQYFQVYRKSRWARLLDGYDLGEDPVLTINGLFEETQGKFSRHKAASNCISLFNRLSEECLDTPHWNDRTFDPDLDPVLRHLLDAYCRYRATLAVAPARTDFSLLQQEALKVLQAYTGSPLFSHIIIDEYQDTNTIQERIFFELARHTRNLCVVGDEDQALYRFRGATVENFVQFPDRCKQIWSQRPREIPLVTNYRSRRKIVDTYKEFMSWCDWSQHGKPGGRAQGAPYAGDHFRVASKVVDPHSKDTGPSVVASTAGTNASVAQELATFCKQLIDEGTVANPNQIAFLFPSLKGVIVGQIKDALEAHGLRVYAPRAGTFLQVPEARDIFGVMLAIFGRPDPHEKSLPHTDYGRYHAWLSEATAAGVALMAEDRQLKDFVADRKAEILRVCKDRQILTAVATKNGWDLKGSYDLAGMRRKLHDAPGLSDQAKRSLVSATFDTIVKARQDAGEPFNLQYIFGRATALDWNLLDLFYRLCGFKHFNAMIDLAETGEDEGPVCNLSLVSQYIGRFMEEFKTILTAETLDDDKLQQWFFSSYLYALFLRGESEFEDANDPFPRGRIPFLTIHQSKGLQFPVVVLGNTAKRDRGAQSVETLVAPLIEREGEPLDRIAEFDTMRLFYVALSRAQNLLVLAHPKGAGISLWPAFSRILTAEISRIPTFDVATVPKASIEPDDTPRNYSFTGDFLLYGRCPRQYMVFRKYGFTPSHSQTMMFGSLVHSTIDDLHQFLITTRQNGATR